jgi:hypothetical protein
MVVLLIVGARTVLLSLPVGLERRATADRDADADDDDPVFERVIFDVMIRTLGPR